MNLLRPRELNRTEHFRLQHLGWKLQMTRSSMFEDTGKHIASYFAPPLSFRMTLMSHMTWVCFEIWVPTDDETYLIVPESPNFLLVYLLKKPDWKPCCFVATTIKIRKVSVSCIILQTHCVHTGVQIETEINKYDQLIFNWSCTKLAIKS